MEKKMLDFDRFLQEARHDVLYVRIHGVEYPVRAAIPAIVPLQMARAEAIEDPEARNTEYLRLLLEAAEALFGDACTEILASGLSVDELAHLIRCVFEEINGVSAQEELSDEAGLRVTGKKSPSSTAGMR